MFKLNFFKKQKNIGYKAMNSNMTCLEYQFKVGKTYKIKKDSKLELCYNGFHFCFNPVNCLNYYDNLKGDIRFFKIKYDKVDRVNDKACTNKITILEEINILDYIRENKDTVNWYHISEYQKLSEDLIREFKDRINWFRISEYQKLSEDLIREFKDTVDWHNICKYQKLSESFIREFKDTVDWHNISEYQTLSEDFIREHKEYVKWSVISQHQILSEDFIEEFQDEINWTIICYYQNISDNFMMRFKDKLKLFFYMSKHSIYL